MSEQPNINTGETAPDKAKIMAFMYVHGPEGVRGSWDNAAKAAGYVRPPRPDSQNVWQLIKEQSGNPDNNPIAQLLAEAEGLSWPELAERIRPIMVQIAAGKIWATSQQVTMLKEIATRGEGKAGATKEVEDRITAVVVLPALGTAGEMQLCPRCVSELAKGNIPPEQFKTRAK